MSADKTWDEVIAELWPKKTIDAHLLEISNMSKQLIRALSNSEEEYKERLAKIEAGEPIRVTCQIPMHEMTSIAELTAMSEQFLRTAWATDEHVRNNKPIKVTCQIPNPDLPNRNHDVITKEAWDKTMRKAKTSKLELAAYELLDNIGDSLWYLDRVKTDAAKVIAALDLASDEVSPKLLPSGSWDELRKAATALRLTAPETGWTVHSLLTALQNVTVSENDNGTETHCNDS